MKNAKKIILLSVVFTILSLILLGCANEESKYNKGVEAMNNGEWDSAIEYFSSIEYEDSKTLLEKCIREKGMHEKADYAFLDTMSESLMKRYESSKDSETDAEIKKFIDVELETIKSYKDADFFDSELQELAINYINGVELEQQSFAESNGNKQIKYYEGHAKRFECLKALTDNYGFLIDNADYRASYYNKVEREIEYYTAFKQIEDDLGLQMDNLLFDYINDTTFRVQITNNTKYDYDMLMHFIFKDKNKTIVGTNDIYYDNIQAGTSYNLDFYLPENADTFDWYTEEYIRNL